MNGLLAAAVPDWCTSVTLRSNNSAPLVCDRTFHPQAYVFIGALFSRKQIGRLLQLLVRSDRMRTSMHLCGESEHRSFAPLVEPPPCSGLETMQVIQ